MVLSPALQIPQSCLRDPVCCQTLDRQTLDCLGVPYLDMRDETSQPAVPILSSHVVHMYFLH